MLRNSSEPEKLHVVLFQGQLETLDFFSHSLCDRNIGVEEFNAFDYYFVDVNRPETFLCEAFHVFVHQENVVCILFNQIGLSLAGKGQNIWEYLDVPVYTFMVDHPRNFYDAFLEPPVRELHVIVLDRLHEAFIREYYPEIKHVHFLPNGGMPLNPEPLPWGERDIDILYTGDCQETTELPPLPFLQKEGQLFYEHCMSELKVHPERAVEEIVLDYFVSGKESCQPGDMIELMFQSVLLLELNIRCYFKQNIIRALDRAGLRLEIYGRRWEQDGYCFGSNTGIHSRVSSEECNRLVSRSKIALNFLPWYKYGCSERVFNNMLNGAVCVTDTNAYLRSRFIAEKDIVFFDLNQPEQLVAKIRFLLDHPQDAERIAWNGFQATINSDTWPHRMQEILRFVRSDMEAYASLQKKDAFNLGESCLELPFADGLKLAVSYLDAHAAVVFEIPGRTEPDYEKWLMTKRMTSLTTAMFQENGRRYIRIEAPTSK